MPGEDRRGAALGGHGAGDRSEVGAGVISSMLGVLVVLVLLLFAVQVLYGLYATSVVTAVTYDAARSVAGSDGGPAARADAQRNATTQLGRYGGDVTFTWDVSEPAGSAHDAGGGSGGESVVRLTIRAERPSLLPRALLGHRLAGDIVRTVQVRAERVR